CRVSIASSSETWPQNPPMAHAPKLISETFQPVRPSGRYFTFSAFRVLIYEAGKYKRTLPVSSRTSPACAGQQIFFIGCSHLIHHPFTPLSLESGHKSRFESEHRPCRLQEIL